MALRVYSIVALCAEMEQGNQQAVSASTASSSQNSLTGGGAASSSQKAVGLLVLLRTQRPAVVEARSR